MSSFQGKCFDSLTGNVYPHVDIICDGCQQFIRGIRYRCGSCADFDLCTSCFDNREQLHASNHEFYLISYQPLTMPRHDGADYEMLCRFDQGKTSESFYLHYPWLFSIDIVKQLLQGTVNQEADEAAVHQIANFMQTSQENDIALDQHVRSVRSELWNWQTVQEHVRVITELMITRARHSQDLYRLALQFCELINQDIMGSMFSGGSQMDERQPPVSGSANIYDLHIQMQLRDQAFTTRNELNQLSKIFSRYFQEQENRWRCGITGSVGNPSPLVKYLHLLSMEVDLKKHDFPLLEETMEALRIDKQHLQTGKRWNRMTYEDKRREIRDLYKGQIDRPEADWNIEGSDFPGIFLQDDFDPSRVDALKCGRNHRRLGEFDEAIACFDHLDRHHSHVAFEILHSWELRGHLARAVDAIAGHRTEVECALGCCLLSLAKAYLECFTKGNWNHALRLANDAFSRYLKHLSLQFLCYHMVYLELYYHKILLAVRRDLGIRATNIPTIVSRLSAIRNQLQRDMRHSEAWDVALLEVELLKAPVKIYQLKNFEYMMDTIDWEYDVESTDRISDEFIGSCLDVAEPLGGDIVEKGKAYLLKAEVAVIKNQSDTVRLLTRKAEEIFALAGYELGAADAQLLRIVSGTEPDIQKGLNDVQQLFSAKDYLPGLEQVIRHRSSDGVSLDSPRVISTSPEAHSALLPILKQSGNKFRFLLHQLNTMDTWISAPSFIAVCEKVFHPDDGFQSDELALLATKLLSYLYSINNNSREAATNALLHLQYSHIREFGEHLQSAIVNYLRVIADATSKLDDHLRVEELSNIANVWDKWLYKSVKEWDEICRSGKQIIYADLPIETVLWLPNAVLSAASNNSLNLLSPLLLHTVSSNIQLAIELLGTLPVNLRSPFAHQIGGALGSAAEYCGNPILALLCYDAARCGCAHHDEFALRSLELHIGRLLASLIVWDRDSYCEFEEVARSYLHEVENFYWSDGRSQLSYKKGLQASLSLATSYLTKVQSLIEELDLGEDSPEEDRSLEQQGNVDRLCQLLRTGLASTAKAISGSLRLRQGIVDLAPMQALENKRLFYTEYMEKIYWTHMGLEMDLSRVLRDPTCVWSAIQQWKAVCLVDSISKSLIGSKSLQRPADEVAPSAVAMGISSTDSTVPDRSTVSYPQAEQLSPQENIANALSELDRTEGATVDDIWYLAEVAKQHLPDGQSIIFVDWARYYNTFFITLFNGTDGRLRKCVIDIDYSFVESWVTKNLGLFEHEDGRKTRRRLMSIASLSKLWLLIADVISFSKEGDLLILCPSGIQHSVPLHAIPIEPNGPPLITRNPIVYCASIATMAKCVKKLQERKRDGPFRAAGFARFGIEDLVEEARMEAAVREGMNHFAMSRVVSGRKLTRNTFSDCTHNIDLLHYHGHASLEISHIIRGLVFEPDPESNDSGHFSVMDIFELNLSACIVVLLACASGEEDVAPNDDPLGLLSAFLFSGASTVIATMWPTQTADARMFTERFYRIAFSNGVDGSNGIRRSSVLYLAHVFQQAVIELIDEFDGDEPYHWAQFCLHGAWLSYLPDGR